LEGQGKFIDESNDQRYVGGFKGGKFEGKGKASIGCDLSYEGEFRNGEFEGKGVFLNWNEGEYKGSFN